MIKINAKDVAELRALTGLGIMDCKKALIDAEGNIEVATSSLKAKGAKVSERRSGNETPYATTYASVVEDGVGRVAMIQCETDFTAASAEISKALEEMVVSKESICETDLETLSAKVGERLAQSLETIVIEADGSSLFAYNHSSNGRNVESVLVATKDVDLEAENNLALHIAFAKPTYLSADHVPKEVSAQVLADAVARTTEEFKDRDMPKAKLDGIAAGRVKAWEKENCLLSQGLLGEKQPVSGYIGDGKILGFIHFYAQGVVNAC